MPGSLVIEGGCLIDGTGNDPVEGVAVLIQDSVITGVDERQKLQIPDDARVLDARGKTVMPGLIDSHLHLMGLKTNNFIQEGIVVPEELRLLRASVDAGRLLDAGFTTVKDCGSTNALYIKRAIAEGTTRGPRILASGNVLTITGGHAEEHYLPYHWAREKNPCICDGPAECMKAARYVLREGADFIKICTTGGVMSEKDSPHQTQFTMDEIRAVVEVAEHAGTFVTAHSQGTEGMRQSIQAGIKTIDHALFPDQNVIEMGLERGTVFVPTLPIAWVTTTDAAKAVIPKYAYDKSKSVWDESIKNIAWLKESGATMATGTDFAGTQATPMGANALAITTLVKYTGFSEMEAIVAGTLGGAKACAMEDKIGSIEQGKLADIIIVDGNPLKDIKILMDHGRIRIVIKEGNIEVDRGLP